MLLYTVSHARWASVTSDDAEGLLSTQDQGPFSKVWHLPDKLKQEALLVAH